jgi:hypothetical protein
VVERFDWSSAAQDFEAALANVCGRVPDTSPAGSDRRDASKEFLVGSTP